MSEGVSKLQLFNTVLFSLVLITTTMATCSNSRLEQQFIDLRKSIDAGDFSGSVSYDPNGAASAPSGTNAGGAAATSARRPGDPSPVVTKGWGGKQANVTYVEGAVPNAPLRLKDKPKPQNDWYVKRRGSAPSSLNYYTTNEGETSTVTALILGRLIGVDPDRPPATIPGLAMEWEVSDDKLTYTYHLRRGVQFADGRPFTAADVKFSFDVMRDPEVQADHMRSGFDDVESLETPDPYTVVVKYKKKYWKGLYTIGYTLRVLNKGWYEEQIPKFAEKLEIAEFSTEPGKEGFGKVFNEIRIPCPGTGPYYLADEDDFNSDFISLVQNPFYYGIQVYPERYNMLRSHTVYIPDRVTAMEAFRKQEFDITVVDHDTWEDQLSKDETITGISKYFNYDHTGIFASAITWNCRQAPFDDPRVRRAMTHLINRQWILDEIERGNGQVAVCNSKPVYPTYSHDLPAKEFNVEKALELLAEAGWKDTDGDGVLDKDGKRFEWELKVPSGYQFYVRVGGLVEDGCKKAGIRCTTRPVEWSTFIDDYYYDRFDGICLYHSWSDVWIDQYEEYHSSQDRPKGGNRSGWQNAEVDKLLEDMREEFDEEKRTAMFHRFNKLFYDEQPVTLLIHGTVGVLINSRFEEVKVRPSGMAWFDFWVKPENVRHR